MNTKLSPQLFQTHTEGENQLHVLRDDVRVTPADLLSMPSVSHHHGCITDLYKQEAHVQLKGGIRRERHFLISNNIRVRGEHSCEMII